MNRHFPATLIAVAFSLAFVCPHGTQAQSSSNADANTQQTANTDNSSASSEAMQMVPAQAALLGSLDSKKVQPGQQFQAALAGKVHLKNGVELPSGTKLVGTIVNDNTQSGKATLALRFTQAQLKDGKTVPIKAIIVGVNPPQVGPPVDTTTEPANTWNYNAQQVDDVGVMNGVDLHSRVNGENSGVFVATKKNDVKFAPRSQFALAIAPADSGA
jgi:hypothetical protein